MIDTLVDRSKRILDEAHYATLATVSRSGEPWSSAVHYIWLHDPLRMLFSSVTDSRHSRNVADHPLISGSLFITGVSNEIPIATVDGAQFVGTCAEVPQAELQEYHARFFEAALPDPELRQTWMLPQSAFRPPRAHRLYLITITRWWIIDLSTWAEDKIDRRIEVPASELPRITP